MMKWTSQGALVFAALVIALVSTGLARAHPPTSLNADSEKGVVEEIKDFRKRLADAIAARDAAALRGMYAAAFVHTHTSAKTDNKDARIVTAIAGDPVIENAPVDDLVIHGHAGGWAATAFGTSPIKSLADGKIYAVRWSVFYVRTDTGWHVAASQATRSHEIKP